MSPTPSRPVINTKLSCFYANVDILTKSKVLEIENLIQDQKPDIICITEFLPKSQSYPPDTKSTLDVQPSLWTLQ